MVMFFNIGINYSACCNRPKLFYPFLMTGYNAMNITWCDISENCDGEASFFINFVNVLDGIDCCLHLVKNLIVFSIVTFGDQKTSLIIHFEST